MPKILLAILFFVAVAASSVAQNGVNAPLSQYGIGSSGLPCGLPLAYTMGGVVYSRSGFNYVNPFNPASYATIQSESFVFDISLNLASTRLSDSERSLKDFDGNLASLAIAFPVTKRWKMAAGVLPYSSTLYETVVTEPVGALGQQVRTIYDGTGGVSRLYWGNAFNILGDGADYSKPSLQGGVNVNYLFGYASRAITYDFVASDTSFFQDMRRQKETRISNFTFDFGVLYRHPLNERYSLTAALTCKVPQKLTIDDDALVYTFVNASSSEYILDTIFPGPGADSKYESTLEQPFELGVGLSLERNRLWQIAADFTYAPYSGMKYTEGIEHPIFGESGQQYRNDYRFAIGGGWLGNMEAQKYIGRIGVTGGAYYESGKLALQLDGADWRLDEWGVGLGLTFPMRRGRSQLQVSFAYASYGTLDLVRAETFSVGITLSCNEHWFAKRKYN